MATVRDSAAVLDDSDRLANGYFNDTSQIISKEVGENVTAGNVGYIRLSDGLGYVSDISSSTDRFAHGIWMDTITSGNDAKLITRGVYTTSGLTVDTVYYLGASGALTTTVSPVKVGIALSTTRLYIQISNPPSCDLMDQATGSVSGGGAQTALTKTFNVDDFAAGDICYVEVNMTQNTGGGGGSGTTVLTAYDGTNTNTAAGGQGGFADKSSYLWGKIYTSANVNNKVDIIGEGYLLSSGANASIYLSAGSMIANWITTAWTIRLTVDPGDARTVQAEWRVYRLRSNIIY